MKYSGSIVIKKTDLLHLLNNESNIFRNKDATRNSRMNSVRRFFTLKAILDKKYALPSLIIEEVVFYYNWVKFWELNDKK